MKKIVSLLLTTLILIPSMRVSASERTEAEAQVIAKQFIATNASHKQYKGIPRKASAVPLSAAFACNKSGMTTDMSVSNADFFVYNIDGDNGFIIISGDDEAVDILGYSDNGSIDLNNMPENMKVWLQGYAGQIESLKSSGSRKAMKKAASNVGTTYFSTTTPDFSAPVSPLLDVRGIAFNQNTPYNNYCPTVTYGPTGDVHTSSTVTGCVATAMAQVMKFWQWPTNGTGSNSYDWSTNIIYNGSKYPNTKTLTADFTKTYDWNNTLNTYTGSETTEQMAAIATLMYDCGVAVNMDYNINGSGSNSYSAAKAFVSYFKYSANADIRKRSNYTDDQWNSILIDELSAGRPVLYSGEKEDNTGGHAFICDGYTSDEYYHFNWGWNGQMNGNFKLNSLKPNDEYNLNNDFSYHQNIITQLAPNNQSTGSKDYLFFSSGITSTTATSTKSGKYDLISYFANYSAFPLSTAIGMGVYDVNGNYQGMKNITSITINSNTYSNFILTNWNLPLTTLSDGTYFLRVIHIPSGTTDILPAKITTETPNSLRLKITGNNVLVENPADYSASALSLTSLTFNDGALYKGQPNAISANISNTASYDFYSFCAVMLVDGSGHKTLLDKKLVFIAAKDSAVVDFTADISTLALGSYTAYLVIDKYNYPLNTDANLYSLDDAAAVSIYPYLDETATNNTTPAATYGKLKMKRTFTSGNWSTICLPFALSSDQIASAFGAGTQIADLTGISVNALTFNTVTAIEPHTPYLIKPQTVNSDNIYTFSNVSVTAGKPNKTIGSGSNTAQFIGAYDAGSNVPVGSFFIQNNKFYQTSSAIPISGFRAYLTVSVPDGTNQMDIIVDGENITSIDGIIIDGDTIHAIYHINGQLMQRDTPSLKSLSKGIYIINGKKTAIK